MTKPTSVKEAVKKFEEANNVDAGEAERVELWGQIPPIEKMDATLSSLKNCTYARSQLASARRLACRYLSLSSNNVDKISSLSGMEKLRVLSLGRNLIKKIENLDGVVETLEELWISYNQLEKLVDHRRARRLSRSAFVQAGVEKLSNLTTLYLSNNRIKEWSEIERLSTLEQLNDLLLVGNPIYNDFRENIAEYRIEAIKRLPQLKKLDGIPVDVDEREAAETKRNES